MNIYECFWERLTKRPWWLPSEDVKPVFVYDPDLRIEFHFASKTMTFSPIEFLEPLIIFDRVLSNEEITLVSNALSAKLMSVIYALKPLHVRYKGDLDEDGNCNCVICKSERT